MRLHWIDALKGIGIMLVVLAHHSLPIALDTYIFSFHMPLFFFISGFLFSFGKYADSTSNFIKARFSSLIIPYFCFAIITCIYYYILDELYTPEIISIKFFENTITHGISHIITGFGLAVSYNPPLWFLTCLFVTELLFYGLSKRYHAEPHKIVLWILAAGIVGYLYSIYVPFRILWNVDVALVAIVFYGAGNLFRSFVETKEESGITGRFTRVENFIFIPFILLNLLYLGYLLEFPTENKVNMNVMQYGNFFSFYLLAFSGIFTFVYLFKHIGGSKVLEYYGRNSLIILALHFPLKDLLTKIVAIFLGVNSEYFYFNVGFALGFTVLNLILLVPVIYIINNYFPFILGRSSSKIPKMSRSFSEKL